MAMNVMAILGFSPYEKMLEVLNLIQENCEGGPSPGKNNILYILDLSEKLHMLGRLVWKNVSSACTTQGQGSDNFFRDKVLAFLLSSSSK